MLAYVLHAKSSIHKPPPPLWHFSGEKKRLRQHTHKLRASKNLGPFFWRKKTPAATHPQVRGFQKYGGHFSEEKKRLRQRTHKLGASKILVPRKNGEPERRSLSVCRGARGAAGPPPGGLGGWKPPRNSRGSGGRQPPSKNNFMVFHGKCSRQMFTANVHGKSSRQKFAANVHGKCSRQNVQGKGGTHNYPSG